MNFGNVGHNTYSANKLDALASQVMGNSFRYDDLATSSRGSKSEQFNSLSSQSGSQVLGGGLEGSMTNSMLASQLGKNFDFNSTDNLNGNKLSGGKLQTTAAGSIQATDSSGNEVMVDYKSGDIFQKDHEGKYRPFTGTFTVNQNGVSTEAVYRDGKEYSRTVDSAEGRAEAKTMDNGIDKKFILTSGVDKDTFSEGILHGKSGKFEVTNGKTNGVEYSKSNSATTTYSASTANKVLNELTDSFSKGLSQSETLDKAKIESQGLKYGVDGRVQADSAQQAIGWLIEKGSGVSASAGLGMGLQYSNDGSLSFKTSDGKTHDIKLSGSAKSAFESSLSKNSSDEEKTSTSRDLMPKQIEKMLNDGVSNGATGLETMNYIARNKDNISAGNTSRIGTGATSQVENGPNFKGIDKQSKNLDIDQSAYYGKEERKSEINREFNAVKLNNDEEKLTFGSNVSGSVKNGKILDDNETSKKEREELNKQYNESKNEGIGSYATNSLGQKVENMGITSKELTDDISTSQIMDTLTSTYNPKEVKNQEGEVTKKWNTPETMETSRDVVKKLDSEGVVDYNRLGDSKIRDWNKVENLSKEQIGGMIKFDDWDKETNDKLNKIYEQKTTVTNQQSVSQSQNNSVNFKADGESGNIDAPTKGITETLKVMETNKNKAPQQTARNKEEIGDRKSVV